MRFQPPNTVGQSWILSRLNLAIPHVKTCCPVYSSCRQFSRSYPLKSSFPKSKPRKSNSLNDVRATKILRLRRFNRLLIVTATFTTISLLVYFNWDKEKGVFDAPRFTPFTIVSKENVSSTSMLLSVRPTRSLDSDPYAKYWEKGLWSVEFKQPQLQIARSYTPLPPDETTKEGDLRFLIRREPTGEMSNYLFRLQEHGNIELRGPYPEFDLPEDTKEVVFLAGGTGIAPALQVVHTLLEARKTNTIRPRIHIIWANRRREECIGGEKHTPKLGSNTSNPRNKGIVVHQLEELRQKHPNNLLVDYVVDEEGTFIDQKMISQATKFTSETKYGAVTTRLDSKLLFVSGPEGFIDYLAGPKKWEAGKHGQGDLGGVLGRMGIKNWKVFKL